MTLAKTRRPGPPRTDATPAPERRRGDHKRWLLFVHQVPSSPSNLRVRTWRRLQQLGAVPIKQAVYVLPDSPGTREDFEWLRAEVIGAGGDATVFAADTVDPYPDDALVEQFRRAAQDAYASLARDLETIVEHAGGHRRRAGRAPAVPRLLSAFQERLAAVERTDFFGAAGRDRVKTLLTQLGERAAQRGESRAPAGAGGPPGGGVYEGRLWVTRSRPGVDRLSSAWLIRRFIDPRARFAFAADRDAVPADGMPFDMFGVELTHQGDGCTFETLCASFGIREPAVARLAAIVHDLDLKDARFGAPEAGTVGALIDGLQLAHPEDEALLEQGIALFEALYRSFDRSSRPAGPRPVARGRTTGQPAVRKPARRPRKR